MIRSVDRPGKNSMGKMAKRPRSTEELEELLHEQLAFLESSAAAFDAGMDGEAKRLAVALRVLLHDTKNSHSLLGPAWQKERQVRGHCLGV